MIHAPVRASHHSSKVQGSRPKKFVLPPCRVCGDKAAGFHYGANTCEACKGFFHRSLRRKEDYKCLGVGSGCDVRPGKQRSCPRCRFQKCLDAGMSRAAIKTGRYTYVKRNQDNLEVQNLQRMSRQYDYTHHHHHHHHHNHHQRMPYPHSVSHHPYLPTPNPTTPYKSSCEPEDPPSFPDKTDYPEAMIPIFLQSNNNRKEEYDTPIQNPHEESTPRRHDISNHTAVSAEAAVSPLTSPQPISSPPSSSDFSSNSAETGESAEPKSFQMENFEMLDFLDLTDNTISHVAALPSTKLNRSHSTPYSKFSNLEPSGDSKTVSSIMNKSSIENNYPSKYFQSSFRPHFNSNINCSWHIPDIKSTPAPFYGEGVHTPPYRHPSLSSSSQSGNIHGFKEAPCINPMTSHNNNVYYNKFDHHKTEQVLGFKQNMSTSAIAANHNAMLESKAQPIKGQHLIRADNSGPTHPGHSDFSYETKQNGWHGKSVASSEPDRFDNNDITLILGL